MIRRTQRLDTDADRANLLAAIGQCRSVCVVILAKVPIRSPLYDQATRLMTLIDDVAEAITGTRSYFWPKLH